MKPIISFCSQCKGRKHHIEKTLLHNLSILENVDGTDFVLLDFDSPDGLEEYILENFQKYLKSGKLKYHKIHNQPYYYQSAVKNLSHNLSTGENMVNVDADNYLSKEYVSKVIDVFKENKNVFIFTITTDPNDFNLYGRIGISRNIFELIKGYDEFFEHWGGEDTDLIRRVKNLSKEMKINIVKLSSKNVGTFEPHERNQRKQFRTEKVNIYESPKKITSRYYGKFGKSK